MNTFSGLVVRCAPILNIFRTVYYKILYELFAL